MRSCAGISPWTPNSGRLPSGWELTKYLAGVRKFPTSERRVLDLVRVSQYVEDKHAEGTLSEELHELFDRDFKPGPVHVLLATLPAARRRVGLGDRYQVIVTTNTMMFSNRRSKTGKRRATCSFTKPQTARSGINPQHIRLLERAGLVVRRRVGREHIRRFRSEPLLKVQEWSSRQEALWRAGMKELDTLLNQTDETKEKR